MYANIKDSIKKLKSGLPFSDDCFNELRDNERFVREAVKIDGINLFWASERVRGNKEIALIAVSDAPEILWCVSDELKDDKPLVMVAVSLSGDTLNNASDRLKNDPEVVLTAVKNNLASFFYASEDLQCAFDNSHTKNPVVILESIVELEQRGISYEVGMDVCLILDRLKLKNQLQNNLTNTNKITTQKLKI